MSNGFPEWWKHGQKVHTRRDGVLTLNIAPDSEYWLTNDDGKEVYVFSADIISPVKKDAEGVIQMSMTTNKQTLREAAEKAISEEGETWWNEEQLASDYGLALHKADAEFIAAANPATVLALLDELEAAERRNAELEARPANPINFKENADADYCRGWAWNEVKKELGTDTWTVGDNCTYYGFFCWGWDSRRQYNEQRADATDKGE